MSKYKTDFLDVSHNVEQIETFTIEATKANEFATKMSEEILKDNEWVNIGDFFPVVINNALHYTFTIRAGKYQ